MLELKGKINTAKVFTGNIEETAVAQVIGMLNEEITRGTQVRIMPDVHAGKGSTVGTTIMFKDKNITKVSPNVVGVDIGCGIMMWKVDVKKEDINFEQLDRVVAQSVPTGFTVHTYEKADRTLLEGLSLKLDDNKISHILKSVGTLGGGNHYIELAEDEDGGIWLSVHSGSRNLGVQVATSHQKIAEDSLNGEKELSDLISKMKKEGKNKEIQSTIEAFKATKKVVNKDLSYLEGDLLDNYLSDMVIAQSYAHINRAKMLEAIVAKMSWETMDHFDSIHNYIDVENGIIRKGATSAQEGERLVIPLNMRDGSLICVGKGNVDWNFSAPHGAGRTMSRGEARRRIDFDTYKAQMGDVYSTSVVQSTLDEAPDAYKSADEIISNIGNTVEIKHRLKPIYNFKSK